jgi:chromosome partitioning protein
MKWVVFNQKGGVGKSTIVCNLAAISAQRGRKTLVVDLDPQGNTTQYLLGREAADSVEPHLGTFFEESLGLGLFRRDILEMIHDTPFRNLQILPSNPVLDAIHGKLEAKHKIMNLRSALAKLEGYSNIFLDTPPGHGFFTLSALIAADRCLIPYDCDEFSRRALYSLLEDIREVREDHNPDLEVGGIIVNQFQSRALLPQQLVEELIGEGLPILKPFISASVKVRESHHASRPLIDLDPSHKLTKEFEDLYQVIEKSRKPGRKNPTLDRRPSDPVRA